MLEFYFKYSNHFNYIIKKEEKEAYNPPTRMYVNQSGKSFKYRIKAGYYLQLLELETTKLLKTLKVK